MLEPKAKITNKEVYLRLRKLIERRLDASDLILLVLLAGPVRGATAMQKQVFISWKEIYHQESIDAGYYPYKFGPYSRMVDDLLESMKISELIEYHSRKSEGTIYSITPKGSRKIRQRMTKLKISLDELKRRKNMWHDWTSRGYLQYVYRKYPEYATESLVPSHKWE